ncbi:MAG TPA: methyltransferase domain-containing protein [Candidatus Baltobacteraceae bacterium]|nr:methyltransferase domain-containing protein [Candidatus Baltobacteraceae bacterium]
MEIAFLLFLLALAVSILLPFFSLAPWLPTRDKDIGRILALARLKPGERFYDLGCGDGRVVAAAAEQGAVAVGLEISFAMWLVCRVRQALGSARGAKFLLKDLFKQDLSDADAVYVYGTTATNARLLKPKLEAELRPGARVITYDFRIDGWEPAAIDGTPPRDKRIYLYLR